MDRVRQLVRLTGDVGNWILGTLFLIGAAITALATLFQAWEKFPWPVKSLGMLGLMALIVLLIRTHRAWWPWLSGLLTPSEQGGGITQTFMRIQGRVQGLTATGNLMMAGSSRLPIAIVPPIPSSPELVRERAAQLMAQHDRLNAFLFERDTSRNGLTLPTPKGGGFSGYVQPNGSR